MGKILPLASFQFRAHHWVIRISMPQRQPTTRRKIPPARLGLVRLFWQWTGERGWLLRWFWRGMVAGLAGVLLLWLAFELYFGTLARRFAIDDLGKMPERTLVLDDAGNTIGKLHGENRMVVTLDGVSPFFIQALLAREDDRFYDHHGIDWVGVARAFLRNARAGKTVQGASTITMQLARNSFPIGDQKTFHRKFLEIALTQRIESQRSKQAILQAYVNRIFFGNGIYGIERAAQAYFGKSASQLTLDESALLAGIIRGPNKFSPYRNVEGAMIQRDVVLDRMVEKNRLSAPEAARAKSQPTAIKPPPRSASQETYALEAVRNELDSLLDAEEIEDGGLKVFTNINVTLQKAAEASVEVRLGALEKQAGYPHQTRRQYQAMAHEGSGPAAPEYLQGAIVLLENQTGAIRALVGGRDFAESPFNRAINAQRQAGSTFKPFVYAAAIEFASAYPFTPISDDPIRPGDITTAEGTFSPHNSDGSFTGLQQLEYGLIKSRNTMTVRVGEAAGMDRVLALADKAGIKGITGRSPQIYIGNLGASLKSLTSAMSIFPNSGQRCRPYLIDRIENAAGEIVFRSGRIAYEVVSPGTAHLMTGMLQKVMQPGGTAASIRQYDLKSPVGGKTGTTDDFKDAWFIGFNPNYTCGVWVGFDDPTRISGQAYGGRVALPIWADVMKEAERHYPEIVRIAFPKPELAAVDICSSSGQLAGPACPNSSKWELPRDKIPDQICPQHPTSEPGASQQPADSNQRTQPRTLLQRFRSLFE